VGRVDRGLSRKYSLTGQGKADNFGDGVEGTITFDYELTMPKVRTGGEGSQSASLGILPDASRTVDVLA
jgi:hypothetical protein